ncbi:MAG: hypothetical protein JEZ07_19445 [Phycisphaerae bacterium]|nr:hypothetical protein [Phycisphaerae bacterium]
MDNVTPINQESLNSGKGSDGGTETSQLQRCTCGIDGMTVADMYAWCQQNIGGLIELLMDGRYKPGPVRGVQIPKAIWTA